MVFKTRWMKPVVVVLFILGTFILSIHAFEYDIWFHLKSGEIFLQQGIIFHDVFSHAAPHRVWYPYEWLYQITVFGIQKYFGFAAVTWVTAGVSTACIVMVGIILRYIFALPTGLVLVTVFSLYALVYDFLTTRPQVPAALFFLVELFFILLFLSKKKNFLWVTVPVTLIWTNMHASVVFAPLLFIGYAAVAGIRGLIIPGIQWKKPLITLVGWGFVTVALTVLPPIGTTQYRLLYLFWEHKSLISGFIDEWLPLNMLPMDLVPFLAASLVTFTLCIFLVVRKHDMRGALWLLPLTPFPFAAIMAVRNLLWAYIALVFVFAWSVGEIYRIQKIRWVAWGVCGIVLIMSLWLLGEKMQPQRTYVPDNAVTFLKNHHINGNMFNGFGVGGYLLYHLYPDYRVFIDGRVDVYLCCEIPDLVGFLDKKELPDDALKKELEILLAKYDISFVLHATKRSTVSRRIGEMLQRDSAWALVYWGDDFQILVKRDGKNDALIDDFGVKAATPLERTPFKAGQEDAAFSEYERMISIADSARSRNALGMLLMGRGEFGQASDQLNRAIAIEPLFDSPYMNLGELAVQDNDLEEAVRLYNYALTLEENRGFTYVRLGQLYWDFGDKIRAKYVWQKGLSADISEETKTQLRSLIDK